MKLVAKYNTFKALSTLLTVGTPIVTLACCSSLFVHRSETAISAAGVFGLLIALLFCKDKIAENFKMPSAFVLSLVLLILIVLLEKILLPIKYTCITSMLMCGIDEVSFKRLYKMEECKLPTEAFNYKHVGFIFTTTDKLLGGNNGE